MVNDTGFDFDVEFDIALTDKDGKHYVESDHAYAQAFHAANKLANEVHARVYAKMREEIKMAFEAGAIEGYDAALCGADIIIDDWAKLGAEDHLNERRLAWREGTKREIQSNTNEKPQ